MLTSVNGEKCEIKGSGRRATDKNSMYFYASKSSGNGNYDVTLNFGTGHWCSCKGMLSKKRKYNSEGMNPDNAQHWCKHINACREQPEMIEQARVIRDTVFGGGFIAPVLPIVRAEQGRDAAVAAQKAGTVDLQVRLAEIEAEREQLLALQAEERRGTLVEAVKVLLDAGYEYDEIKQAAFDAS